VTSITRLYGRARGGERLVQRCCTGTGRPPLLSLRCATTV
jgi:hypothetical protein